MTLPGQSSHGIEPDPRDVIPQRFEELERRIQRLETANSAQGTTISEGSITVDDADGNPVVVLGDTGIVINPGGNAIGLLAKRADGTTSFTVNPFVAIWDESGHYIITDDVVSGQGLARPYISYGSWVDQAVPTRTTTSGTFVTQQTVEFRKSHPKVEGQLLIYSSDSSTTGEARITTTDGTQLGSVINIATGASGAYVPFGPYDVPGDFLQRVTLNLQVRRTGGNGQVGAVGVSARGIESNPV